MKIDAKELWHAVKNVSIFSRKDGWSGGVQVYHHSDGTMRLRTSDDYVGIEAGVRVGLEAECPSFYISHESIKALEKSLRDKTCKVEISVVGDELYLDPLIWSDKIIDCPDPDWWTMFEYVLTADRDVTTESTFEMSPARHSKFNLLEPKDKYFCSYRMGYVSDRKVVDVLYGPNTTLTIMTLDRSALEQAYGDELKEITW